MPTPPEVLSELSDILVRLVGCGPADVVPEASLKSVGLDSLTMIEMADELGRRFGVYISDDTVNQLTTVKSAVNAIVHHDGSTKPAARRLVAAPVVSAARGGAVSSGSLLDRLSIRPERGAMLRALGLVAFLGAVLGVLFGLGGAALVTASGIKGADLPPLTITATPTAEPTPEPIPEPTQEASEPDKPQPTLTAAKTRVTPGERFGLSGAIPSLGAGAELQVQVKDPDTSWDDFPVTTTTTDGGKFKTVIYTSRTGDRKFRLLHKASNTPTPEVTVRIG